MPELRVVLDGWKTKAWGNPCWQLCRGPPAQVTWWQSCRPSMHSRSLAVAGVGRKGGMSKTSSSCVLLVVVEEAEEVVAEEEKAVAVRRGRSALLFAGRAEGRKPSVERALAARGRAVGECGVCGCVGGWGWGFSDIAVGEPHLGRRH